MEMQQTALAYYTSAQKLGLHVEPNPLINGFNLYLGGQIYYFSTSITPINNGMSLVVASNKHTTHRFLEQAGLPVPKSTLIFGEGFDYDRLIKTVQGFKYPVVLKPYRGTCLGQDVVCNIPDLKALYTECQRLLKYYHGLQIEEFHGGLTSFRVLVFKGKVLDVVARFPAQVTGNGQDDLITLVEKENINRKKRSDFLRAIKFDSEAMFCLAEQGLQKTSIPEEGQVVIMGQTSNASRGGTIQNISKKMHPENKKMFLKAAKVLNLQLVGIDVQCRSLQEPLTHFRGVILELNHNPSMRIHEEGVGGPKKFTSMIIMRSFIYKHPFSYFFGLFRFKKFRIFMTFMVTLFILVLFVIKYFGISFDLSWSQLWGR